MNILLTILFDFLESEAILTIFQRGQEGIYKIVGSSILELEMERMKDVVKKQRVKDLYKVAVIHVYYTEEIKKRSQEIMKLSGSLCFSFV